MESSAIETRLADRATGQRAEPNASAGGSSEWWTPGSGSYCLIDDRWWPSGLRSQPATVAEIDACLRDAGRSRWQAQRPGWTEAGWWDADLLPQVRSLMQLPKGAALLAAVQRQPAPSGARCHFPHRSGGLFDAGPLGTQGNPCACQVVMLAAWATAAAWVSEQADRAALFALAPSPQRLLLDPDRPQLGQLNDPAAEVIGPALRRSPASVATLAKRLRTRSSLPDSLRNAIADGFLQSWQADLLIQDLDLTPGGETLVIDAVVQAMRDRHARGLVSWTFSDLRRRAKRIQATLADELRRQHADARDDRRLWVDRDGNGRSRITAALPDEIARRIFQRLTALALGLDDTDDDRTLDQRRSDVFTDLLLDHCSPVTHSASDPTVSGSGEVAVIINLATLLGADEQPGELRNCGPIPASTARELAADRTWRAWLTDASGAVVATSPRTYTPTASLARLIRARESHCRMPGCRRTRTDLDHVIPWPTGRTTPENLSRLCRRHHNLKTHGNWTLTNETGPGDYTWTDPTGIPHHDTFDPPLRT